MTDTKPTLTVVSSQPEPTVTVQLTKQELTDIRVAMLHRLNILKDGSLGERGEPYTRILAMMEDPDGVLYRAIIAIHTSSRPRDVV